MGDININDKSNLNSLIKTCFILDNPPPLLKNPNLNDLKAEAHLNLGKEYLKLGQCQKAQSEINISITLLEKVIPIKNKKIKPNNGNAANNSNSNSNEKSKNNIKESQVKLLIQCYEISKEIYESQGKTVMIQNMQNRIKKVETLYLNEAN